MTDALKHIGNTLRSAREAKGLALKDIAEVLKIRRLYLDAIEKGDPAELPGLIYFEGYLKNYAKMLGLDDYAILGEYQEYLGSCGATSSDLEVPELELKEKSAKVKTHKKRNSFIFR